MYSRSRNICSCRHLIFSLYFPQSMQDCPELWPGGSALNQPVQMDEISRPVPTTTEASWEGSRICMGMQREEHKLIWLPSMCLPCSSWIWESSTDIFLLRWALSPSCNTFPSSIWRLEPIMLENIRRLSYYPCYQPWRIFQPAPSFLQDTPEMLTHKSGSLWHLHYFPKLEKLYQQGLFSSYKFKLQKRDWSARNVIFPLL